MGNKIPIPEEYFEIDPILCPTCKKQFNSMNEWLDSDCWYIDHEVLEVEDLLEKDPNSKD